jgi:hypothetical protein
MIPPIFKSGPFALSYDVGYTNKRFLSRDLLKKIKEID